MRTPLDEAMMGGMSVAEPYVAALDSALNGPRRVRRGLVTEARDHLKDATDAYRRAGYETVEAERLAVADFGELDEVVPAFQTTLAVGGFATDHVAPAGRPDDPAVRLGRPTVQPRRRPVARPGRLPRRQCRVRRGRGDRPRVAAHDRQRHRQPVVPRGPWHRPVHVVRRDRLGLHHQGDGDLDGLAQQRLRHRPVGDGPRLPRRAVRASPPPRRDAPSRSAEPPL